MAAPFVSHQAVEATVSQLRREPRATLLERPESRQRLGSDGDQLDSLLSELLTLRSAQAHLLAQPSVLKAACSLLPPCPSPAVTAPRLGSPAALRGSSVAGLRKDGTRPLDASSSTDVPERSLSPWCGWQPAGQVLPTMLTTMSSWWHGDEERGGSRLPSVPSYTSVMDLGGLAAGAEPAVTCKALEAAQ